MISYELAKKLKEAGFPQKNPVYVSGRIPNEEFVSYPSLSELIDACGEKFAALTQIKGTPEPKKPWHAVSWDEEAWDTAGEIYEECIDEECCPEATIGETPEEAVAALWLALHNK